MPDLNKASPYRISKGREIEERVADYLQNQGFQLLQRNFRCKLGEIDLIGTYQDQLIFVEVRFRRNSDFGSAAESVNVHKQQKLLRTAQLFLKLHPHCVKLACRFDVVGVTLKGNSLEMDWIQNAFC